MKRFAAVIILIIVVGGIFALGSLRRGADDKPLIHVADEVALTVAVAHPQREGITRLVQAPGDVEAVLEVEISSEIVSKIEQIPIEEGDMVKRGDLLCRLDDDYLLAQVESGEARVGQLTAAVQQAQADLEKAERDCKRQTRLSEADATSELEVLDYQTVLKKARAVTEMREHELLEAQAFLKRNREDLKRTIIESPIDGIISRLVAKEGEVVVTGTMNNPGTVIMTISDLSRMQVRARVDEVNVPHVKSDQKARIYLQSDQQIPVPGRVVRVASKGTKQTGRDVVTFETILEVLSHDPRIKPGMTANVEIEVDHRDDVMTIPVEAVVHRMRKDLPEEIVKAFDAQQESLDISERARQAQYIKVVYIMENDLAKVKLIDSGISDSRRVELRAGLAESDLVVTGPYRTLDQLNDGRKVALSDEDKKKMEEKKEAPTAVAEKDETAEEPNAGTNGAEAGADSNGQKAPAAAVAAGAAP